MRFLSESLFAFWRIFSLRISPSLSVEWKSSKYIHRIGVNDQRQLNLNSTQRCILVIFRWAIFGRFVSWKRNFLKRILHSHHNHRRLTVYTVNRCMLHRNLVNQLMVTVHFCSSHIIRIQTSHWTTVEHARNILSNNRNMQNIFSIERYPKTNRTTHAILNEFSMHLKKIASVSSYELDSIQVLLAPLTATRWI